MSTEHERSDRAFGRSKLEQAVRRLKIETADQNDVVVDMKEADRARLELLAEALTPIIDDIPADDDRFDFALSSGLQPRFWVDATAHVMMGRDRRTYRFVRDTRLGRVVLAESVDKSAIEQRVIDYVAERLLERERVLSGDTVSYRDQSADTGASDKAVSQPQSSDVVNEAASADASSHEPAPDSANQDSDNGIQVPSKHVKYPAEPSNARAFGKFAIILLMLLAAGAAVLWSTGQLG